MINAAEFCDSHNIEVSFISSLREYGLIDMKTIDNSIFIYKKQLNELERIVHLFYELDINLEGIETIIYLLNRHNEMQSEIISLRNRLRLYEDF